MHMSTNIFMNNDFVTRALDTCNMKTVYSVMFNIFGFVVFKSALIQLTTIFVTSRSTDVEKIYMHNHVIFFVIPEIVIFSGSYI